MGEVMTLAEAISILPPYAKLSGSRALGTETLDSDWDFYIPEKHWAEFRSWCLEHLGQFESNITGHIFYYFGKRTHSNLLEFSYMFPNIKRQGNGL